VLDDLEKAKQRASGRAYSTFLDQWGAEVALSLTVIEKSTVNPTALLTPSGTPSLTFSAALGVSASSQATRIEKMNTFYTVRELFRPDQPKCIPSGEKHGSPLVESDLKLWTLLEGRIGSTVLGYAGAPEPGQKNVLSHTVSFQVVTGGSTTPSWKLVRATVNPSGNFFSTTRDRTHEIIITFGPTDKARGGRSLIAIAEQTHLNSQLATGIRAALPGQ
jgi:hypothetical protein